MPSARRDDVAKLLDQAWFPAVGLVLLFLGMAFWGPPGDWLYTLLGFAFLLLLVPVALFSLQFGSTAFTFTLVGACIFQGWLSGTIVPVQRMGGGAEFIMQLCISASGTYLFLFVLRRQILRWLFHEGAI